MGAAKVPFRQSALRAMGSVFRVAGFVRPVLRKYAPAVWEGGTDARREQLASTTRKNAPLRRGFRFGSCMESSASRRAGEVLGGDTKKDAGRYEGIGRAGEDLISGDTANRLIGSGRPDEASNKEQARKGVNPDAGKGLSVKNRRNETQINKRVASEQKASLAGGSAPRQVGQFTEKPRGRLQPQESRPFEVAKLASLAVLSGDQNGRDNYRRGLRASAKSLPNRGAAAFLIGNRHVSLYTNNVRVFGKKNARGKEGGPKGKRGKAGRGKRR